MLKYEAVAVLVLFVGLTAAASADAQTAVRKGSSEIKRSPSQVFGLVSRSLVLVEAASTSKKTQGSGVVTRNGFGQDSSGKSRPNSSWVVTNAHVVRDAESVSVSQSGVRYPAKVEYSDEDLDLALLHVAGVAIPPLEINPDVSVEVGQRVYAIGSPVGLENSITEGLVSGLRKIADVSIVQSSAAISPGNSGGGLFDEQGRLIGITTFKLKGTEGIGFAVSVSHVRELEDADDYAGLVRVVLKLSLEPEDYRILESDRFTKWVRTTRTLDGRRMYQEIERLDDASTIGDVPLPIAMQNRRQAFLEIFDRYRASVGSPARPPRDLLILLCDLVARSGHPLAMTLRVDLQKGLVNGHRASVTDDRISWAPGQDREYVYDLDRYSSAMTILSRDNRPIYSGKCQRTVERKF